MKYKELNIKVQLNAAALNSNLQVFVGAMAGLKWWSAEDMGPTACTDGWEVWVNPEFWESLTPAQKLGLMVHEMLHCFLHHRKRFVGADHTIANIACDYVINDMIMELRDNGGKGTIELPPGGLDAKGEYKDEAEEIIYNKLLANKPPEEEEGNGKPGDEDGDDSGPGQDGEGQPGEPGDGKGRVTKGTGSSPGEFLPGSEAVGGEGEKELEEHWTTQANTAAQMAKMKGDFPGSVIKQLLPKQGVLDWKAILQRFVRGLVCDDVSEDQFDRRFMSDGMYLEAVMSPSVEGIVFVKDTSGSMCDEKTLNSMVGEIRSAVEDVKIPRIWVLDVDTRVHAEEFMRGEVIPATVKGGGGTDFIPAFDWVEENFPTATAMIYFTDGYGSFPDQAPNYPVMWVDFGGTDYPFGEVLDMRGAI